MSKAKLKLSIEGKTVVYEGRPESRKKDLLDILVKMKVDPSVAVKAFRENIEDAARYTDENIQQQFLDAQRAYAEKKKRKMGEVVSEEQQKEKPERITLSFKGKQFSYEGLPSSKQYAVIELLIKQDATRELVVETFRVNLPESSASDEEIMSMFTAAMDAKNARKAAKKKDTAGELAAQSSSRSIEQPPPPPPQQQQIMNTSSTSGVDAIEEITGMSVEERDSISNFIKQVLEQPEMDLTARMREESNTFSTVGQ
ncbi:hypothetical protein C4B63_6g596 [Trypanosoma cruzi]|uniref:Uncharacterized protein n=1 Tax=Trypanosoma cruzi TaxID=5693 RepID=A0A2V2VW52_TRYCR|nr:hypothetical protein C4B63_6g596 [Trypanosoma cruzi]